MAAYLVKPLDFEKLLEQVDGAIKKSHMYRAVVSTKQRLQYWQEGLAELEEGLADKTSGISAASVKSFLDLTYSNVAGALSDIKNITSAVTGEDIKLPACHLLDCPKLNELTCALEKTIKVLRKTKSAFKSKDLGELRENLEEISEKKKKPAGRSPLVEFLTGFSHFL